MAAVAEIRIVVTDVPEVRAVILAGRALADAVGAVRCRVLLDSGNAAVVDTLAAYDEALGRFRG